MGPCLPWPSDHLISKSFFFVCFADSGWQKWRTAFFLGAIPCIIAAHFSAFVFVDADAHKRPEFKPYEYMRTRNKKFPWGDGNHTLLHNPHTNALPDGYETEEEHH